MHHACVSPHNILVCFETMVNNHVAVLRASSIAKESNEQQKPKSATDFVKYSKAMIEFQILCLQSELELLNELSAMSDNDKMEALFDMLDQDDDGKLSAVEIAEGLRKIKGDVNFEESLTLAIDRVATFDTDEDGVLNRKEFEKLLNTILPLLGCSFHELSDMLVLTVLFTDTRNTHEENIVAEIVSDQVKVEVDEGLRRAMKDRRMKALFNVFDQDGNGWIDFKQVVVGMYKLMDDIDQASHAAVTALLLFDEKQTRELSYKDFVRLMLNVVASSPEHITFNDVADTLTRNATSVSGGISSDYVMERFSMDSTSKLLLDIAHDDDLFVDLSVVELSKIDRLFAMFGVDDDGKIGSTELALALRKFHDTTGMKTTVEESTQVMSTFDKAGDGRLSEQDFATFIVNFASTANIELVDMLDFMIVVSALKENTDAEQEYIKAVGGGEEKIDSWYAEDRYG